MRGKIPYQSKRWQERREIDGTGKHTKKEFRFTSQIYQQLQQIIINGMLNDNMGSKKTFAFLRNLEENVLIQISKGTGGKC